MTASVTVTRTDMELEWFCLSVTLKVMFSCPSHDSERAQTVAMCVVWLILTVMLSFPDTDQVRSYEGVSES